MTLEEKLETTLAGLGYELVDWSHSAKSGLVRVFLDSAEGISLDDCVTVSNHLSNWLTVENVDYDRLEVSSPGSDRPLKKLADFHRFHGQRVQIRLRIARNGQRRFVGVIGHADAQALVIHGDGEDITIDMDNIDQARLAPEV